MTSDTDLIRKPMAMDLLLHIVREEGATKTEILRGYQDMVSRTIHFRISEMFDLGWIEYRASIESSRRIFPTEKGVSIRDAVTVMLDDVAALEYAEAVE